MKKKVLTVLIVACLMAGSIFAAQGDIKVGAHVGYGFDWIKVNEQLFGGKIEVSASSNGFYFAANGEYEFVDGFSAKVELGAMTMGKLSQTLKGNDGEEKTVADKATPINFSAYLGAKYEALISGDFGAFAGLGVDAMLGKQSAQDDEPFNGRIGLGLEAGGVYNFNEKLSFNLGARYSIYFFNTAKEVRDAIKELRDHNGKVLQHGLKVFAGATYSL